MLATSGITLTHEYVYAAPAAGLDERLVRQARANALGIAFLSESDKAALLKLGPNPRRSPEPKQAQLDFDV